MPTTAKLFSALWFAAMGWLAANAHVPALGENAAVGALREITALIGLFCGWFLMGRLVGGTLAEAVSNGLRTAISVAFLALLGFSTLLMVRESMRMRYDGPMEAVIGIFTLMMENGYEMLTVGVLGVFLLGGVLGGLLAEAVFRRWR